MEAAVAVGSAAPYDLLQVQVALAGQQAALAGAEAMEQGARSALGPVIGVPLAADVQPEPLSLRAADVLLPDDLEALIARAVQRRPDLREAAVQLAGRRLQSGLAAEGGDRGPGAGRRVQLRDGALPGPGPGHPGLPRGQRIRWRS